MEIKVYKNKYPRLQCSACARNVFTVSVLVDLYVINLCSECISKLSSESSIIFNNENNHENNN